MPSLLLVGAGRMGGALLRSWLSTINSEIHVLEPSEGFTAPGGVLAVYRRAADIPEPIAFDAVVLAVKPQLAADVLPSLAQVFADDTLAVSILAGTQARRVQQLLGRDVAVVRAMPNLPAITGQGMTGLYATSGIAAAQRELAERLFTACGQTLWVSSEHQLDALTAVSGSGPAYVFHLVEALAQAAETQGFTAEDAMLLARQTVTGSAALMAAQPEVSAASMRANVTSPGGTTAAGLDVLQHGNPNLQELLQKTVAAAAARAQELANF